MPSSTERASNRRRLTMHGMIKYLPLFEGEGVAAGGGGTVAAPASWITGVPNLAPELSGHIQNKGWHTMTAIEAASAAAQAHREAEQRLGVPSSELIRVPKGAEDP